ncbi:HAD family hydrolase [Reinekea thalattae]|uniref:phosphoglycolate phosphatase n=1 Tax=Reinekea thalattae TaxID=2593301 RepID=A0A5C8Z509_9GAMM|nr:HAD family phosphatase [Reinekea thalattae]TXR53185.1 HAD family phosphatase [Reinekea thalattae]
MNILNNKNYKAILWDNDGILVNTEQWYYKATLEAFASFSIKLSSDDFYTYFLEGSSGTSVYASLHGLSESNIASLKQKRNELYNEYLSKEDIVIEGVKETLEKLKSNYVMAIVTSSRKSHFETIHNRTGLLKYFNFVITREDYAFSKPSPEPYLTAANRSGFNIEECVAIEDSPRGLLAAKAASIDCIVIPNQLTKKADFNGATYKLENITDIPSVLLPNNE